MTFIKFHRVIQMASCDQIGDYHWLNCSWIINEFENVHSYINVTLPSPFTPPYNVGSPAIPYGKMLCNTREYHMFLNTTLYGGGDFPSLLEVVGLCIFDNFRLAVTSTGLCPFTLVILYKCSKKNDTIGIILSIPVRLRINRFYQWNLFSPQLTNEIYTHYPIRKACMTVSK
jgi:hypothetical protein